MLTKIKVKNVITYFGIRYYNEESLYFHLPWECGMFSSPKSKNNLCSYLIIVPILGRNMAKETQMMMMTIFSRQTYFSPGHSCRNIGNKTDILNKTYRN